MTMYEVYDDTECPRCGNTERNHDDGPYDYHPLDDELGGTPDPRAHLMWCGRCGKPFDVIDRSDEEYAGLLRDRGLDAS